MKVKVYHDPITCKNLMDGNAEILDLYAIERKMNRQATHDEIAAYNRYKEHGIRTGLVKYSDGSILDNVWFKESDIY